MVFDKQNKFYKEELRVLTPVASSVSFVEQIVYLDTHVSLFL